MSKLITGKEAKIAWADGERVEYYKKDRDEWFEIRGNTYVTVFEVMDKFRLKPKTININNSEVPAPFKPSKGERYWYISTDFEIGYNVDTNYDTTTDKIQTQYGAWRTEEEIKQVVEALRKLFKES